MSGERLQPVDLQQKLKESLEKISSEPKLEHYTAKIKVVDGKENVFIVHKYINGR